MKMIDKTITPFNDEKTPVHFHSMNELNEFVRDKGIQPFQEFWFTVTGEDVLFKSIFEFSYEG